MALHTSNALAHDQALTTAADAAGGSIVVYSGAEPATPETANTGILATFALASPAFSVSGNTLSLIGPLSTAITSTGTAQSYRVLKADGTTPLWDGSIALTGGDINLSAVSLVAGASLVLNGLTYTLPGV